MEYGALIPNMGPFATRENILGFARQAEALGFDALFASDHVVIPYEIKPVYKGTKDGTFPVPKEEPFPDPIICMGMVGAVTERIRVGTAVLVLPHRNPILTAKMLSTIDAMTGGRVILGAGVGWMEEEITLLGQPFAERGAWCTEAIDLMRKLWADEAASFDGKFFKIPAVGLSPKPVNRDIPIMIGGTSKPAMRRVVAQGDGWLPSNSTFEMLDEGLAFLREGCDKAGRDFGELKVYLRARMAFGEVNVPYKVMFTGSPQEIVDKLGRLQEMGITMVLFEPVYGEYPEWADAHARLAADVFPKLA
jgi:probable F420-dependent oxidoreductase